MDLFEYQARDLFESHQIPVLAGAVATTPEEAHAAAAKIGGKVVVKAQVKVGGRGKAGGVKLAENADWGKELLASEILSLQDDNFDIDILGFEKEELLLKSNSSSDLR